ncbi:MAG: glycyl radical protein [Clostridiales bacterium]|jgi:formate C-acetyltransferase|nr:glycyl radical protein [Clostridiales bacterium]
MPILHLSPQEEKLIQSGGGIAFSSKSHSRLQKIYDSFKDSKPAVDVQRAIYFTESFKTTHGQPLILRWAKALYRIAESIDVFIDEHQLLVGRAGCQGKYGLIYPELDGCFLESFAKQAQTRLESPFYISNESAEALIEEIAPYWRGKTFYEGLVASLPEDVLKITFDPADVFTSRYIVNETASMRSALQWVHDYKKGIERGFEAIKQDALEELRELDEFDPKDALEKAPFLEAVALLSDAIILWADRHSKLAYEKSEAESDPSRRAELRKIGEICARVPRYPARSFHEALQSQWFMQMFSRLEQKTGATISNGRMDQYLYPYFKSDLETGAIDAEGAKELLQCMWLGMAQYIDLYVSPAGVRFNEGYAHWEAVTIGGVDREGNDAVNELTYLFLEDKREFPLNYPDLAARIHSRSPERYLYEVAETIREGSGFPKLINDEEVVPILLSKGASFPDAYDYAVSGCTEVRMPNRDTYTSPCPYINMGAAVELALNNGRMKKYGDELISLETGEAESFKSWDEFFAAFAAQEKYLLRQAFRQQYAVHQLREKYFASPLGSALHELCIRSHKDLHSAHIADGIDIGYFDLIGFGSAADSLAAIKKNVFERGIVSMGELKEALSNDFRGYEALRQRLISSPSYGNNDPYADSIAKEIDFIAASYASKYAKSLGFDMDLRYVPVTSHIPLGKVVGALPNGRKSGVFLSDGASASHGADANGPTSILLSNSRTKNTAYKNRASRLLNIKLNPSSVKGYDGLRKLVSFIKSWRDLKLWHLQFNIINQETLEKARKDPESYRGLLVRVAGYSAYFVDLTPDLQADIIMRTQHQM